MSQQEHFHNSLKLDQSESVLDPFRAINRQAIVRFECRKEGLWYFRFSRNKCDVSCVKFTQYAIIHSDLTAFYTAVKRYIHCVPCLRLSVKSITRYRCESMMSLFKWKDTWIYNYNVFNLTFAVMCFQSTLITSFSSKSK